MIHTYKVTGMTCGNCKASVEQALLTSHDITKATVDLDSAEVKVESNRTIGVRELQDLLPQKYQITQSSYSTNLGQEPSQLKQLFPLFLIFTYIIAASVLLNTDVWNWNNAMLDFMGLFYVVFSFFKFLDLRGFPKSFSMYDPLAKAIPAYGYVYPFIELLLGLMFLMRLQVEVALVATLIILGITTIGVVRTLLKKNQIQCACLGTALKLPMTKATFIENSIMIVMALIMLFKTFNQ